MKKFLLIVLSVILVLNLTACGIDTSTTQTQNPNENMSDLLQKSSQTVARNQNKLETILPAPKLDYSNERANLIKRATTFGSDENKVSWIYCFLPSGQCVLFTSVKGKVSNLSSYLVPDENIVPDPYFETGGYGEGKWGAMRGVVIQNADIDGSFGENGEGVFWYDTNGVYHEWNGYYMLLDQPTKLNIQPLLVMNIEDK